MLTAHFQGNARSSGQAARNVPVASCRAYHENFATHAQSRTIFVHDAENDVSGFTDDRISGYEPFDCFLSTGR